MGFFKALSIETIGDLKQFLDKYDIKRIQNDIILKERVEENTTIKELMKNKELDGEIITSLIDYQRRIDERIKEEPNNIFLYKMWWTLENAKDELKELFTKV